MSQALEITEHDRQLVLLRQPIDLGVKLGKAVRNVRPGHGALLPRPPSRRRPARTCAAGPRPHGGAPRTGVRLRRASLPANGGCGWSPRAAQDQEGGLEGVLGRVVVLEGHHAHAKDHGAMAFHQGGESRLRELAAMTQEPVDQLPIGQPSRGTRGEQDLKLLEQCFRWRATCHAAAPHSLGLICL